VTESEVNMKFLRLFLASFASFGMPAHAAPSDTFSQVIADHWRWWLSVNPEQASALGVHDYDAQISDISLAAQDRDAGAAKGFLNRLNAIPEEVLSPADVTTKGVLARVLADQIDANRFGQRMMLFSTYSSPHQSFAGLAEGLPFRTKDDYANYLTRLALFPKLNADVISISKAALTKGFVQPCAAMNGFETSITGAVAGKTEETRFYAPFLNAKPADSSDSEWDDLKARAAATIKGVITPEYIRFATFYTKEYQPKCRGSIAASSMPQGLDYYAARAKSHTTTTLTPDEIHQIGVGEVARLRMEMDMLARASGYADRIAFAAALRADPASYAKTPEELLAAAARTAKLIDGKMPQFFGKLPRLPYGLRAIPSEIAETTTTAYYNQGSPESGIAGTYYVNTSKLSQRPLWELPALTAHEAVPGHHNQIALQQELPLPDFRKYAVGFTAFVEGWALYTEHLGIEMGLYDTPAKNMGRLSYEMWRACRLVVDTGMHSKGWSKAQAIAYMHDNTALSDANIEAEINRYISWPGQALAYKIGELKIRELRARAEKALGPKFDIRKFHDAVLGQGAVPLDVLERQIDAWIAAR
jgi:uncharacterized protein (DUF885 family)